MLGRIICWWKGHKRGKKIAQDQIAKTYQCPRCAAQWTRKINAPA